MTLTGETALCSIWFVLHCIGRLSSRRLLPFQFFEAGSAIPNRTKQSVCLIFGAIAFLHSPPLLSRLDTSQATPVQGRAAVARYLTDRSRRGLEFSLSLPLSEQFGMSAGIGSLKRITDKRRPIDISEFEITLDWAPLIPVESTGIDIEVGIVRSLEKPNGESTRGANELYLTFLVSYKPFSGPIDFELLLERSRESSGEAHEYDGRHAIEAKYAASQQVSLSVGWERGYRDLISRKLGASVRMSNRWRIGVNLRRRATRWGLRIGTRRSF